MNETTEELEFNSQFLRFTFSILALGLPGVVFVWVLGAFFEPEIATV
jgi:hypothetical protein